MKTNCDIIRDLLPLYADHLTSEASNALVEEHLGECPACQRELEQMQAPVPVLPEEKSAAPLKKIRRTLQARKALSIVLTVCVVVLLFALTGWMYTAQVPVTDEEAQFWTCNIKQDGADLCVLEVQGEGVRLIADPDFNWGKEVITVQAVRYRFPWLRTALEPLLPSSAISRTVSVSNTQLLEVECANGTRYYRRGQQVYAYRVNGQIVYGTDVELRLYPRV